MRLAGLNDRERCHRHGEYRHPRILQHFLHVDRLRRRKASAIDIHVQQVSPRHHHRKSHHDRRKHRPKNPKLPANQHQKSQHDLGERQRVRDKLNAPRRQQLESLYLKREVSDVHRQRKLKEKPRPEMTIRQECFGTPRVDKDRPENQAAKPHHRAAKIERARLHHDNLGFYRALTASNRRILSIPLICRREADRGTASKCPSSSRPHRERSARWRETLSSAFDLRDKCCCPAPDPWRSRNPSRRSSPKRVPSSSRPESAPWPQSRQRPPTLPTSLDSETTHLPPLRASPPARRPAHIAPLPWSESAWAAGSRDG